MPTLDTVIMAMLFFVVAALVIIPIVAALGWRNATTDRWPRLLARRPRRFWVLWGVGCELMFLSQIRLLVEYRPQSTMTPWIAAGLASVRAIPLEAAAIILCLGGIVIGASALFT